MRFYLIFLLAVASFSCGNTPNENVTNKPPVNANTKPAAVPVYDFQIVKEYPHDPTAFTQGLEYHEGSYTKARAEAEVIRFSLTRKDLFVAAEGGIRDRRRSFKSTTLPNDFFGEGITILGDKIFQITWHEGTAFVYNLSDFKLLKELRYSGRAGA